MSSALASKVGKPYHLSGCSSPVGSETCAEGIAHVKPNIILIVTHDTGDRLGCYGHDDVQTPNLDRIAAEGVRFANNFCTAPLCSPSRGAIITGRYPHSNGLMGLVGPNWSLPESNTRLVQLLSREGYRTVLFGRQHEMRDPTRLGFDAVRVHTPPCHCHKVIPEAVKFLRDAGKDRPFYLHMGFKETHRPFDIDLYTPADPTNVVVPAYLPDNEFTRLDLAQFNGQIEFLDRCIGTLTEALDETGLAEDTILAFTVDHGPAFPRAKSTLYDPGIRTALLMRWPARWSARQVNDELISNVDLMPTLLEAIGATVPECVEGRSFLPLLEGCATTSRTEVFAEKSYHGCYDPMRCVRTTEWKYTRSYEERPWLVMPSDVERSLTRQGMGDDHLRHRPPVELYDLESDPNETENLAGQAACETAEADLRCLLDEWMTATQDPLLRGPIALPRSGGP